LIPVIVVYDIKSNNVASIWLLRGNAGAVMVRNCDGAATTTLCSIGQRSFCPESAGFPPWFGRCGLGSGSKLAEK
jgi:hypothetical protein